MARCRIGPRKLRSKIQPLMPDGWKATAAFVRGGWTHGEAQVFALGPEGEQIVGTVNYLTGGRWEPDTGVLSQWVAR